MQLSTQIKVESVVVPSDPQSERRHQSLAQRNRHVEQTLWVVRALAAELLRVHRFSISLEDLESYGRCGLLEAADSFDERHGSAFTTYAYYRIRGAMFDAIRDGAGGCTQSELLNMRRLRSDASAESQDEAFEHYTIIDHDLAQLVASALSSHDEAAPHDIIDRRRVAEILRAAIAALPNREREVIEHLYFEPGASLATAARKFGIDRSWLSRIRTRALAELRNTLASLEA
jgi:RNA polymerase sigma factor for flagellar operon FliA